jgi:hypothetical protein
MCFILRHPAVLMDLTHGEICSYPGLIQYICIYIFESKKDTVYISGEIELDMHISNQRKNASLLHLEFFGNFYALLLRVAIYS